MGTVSYPLTDEDLARLSRLYEEGKIAISRQSKLKNGGTNLYMTDGTWNYLVVQDPRGDWTWGFKTEVS